jgi:molecular chaperone GrpE
MNEQTREQTGHEADAEPNEKETGAEQAEPETGTAESAPEPSPGDQLAEMKDRLLRAMAEAENVRRRSEREKAEAQKFGMARFARDLLSVADNLRRALDSAPPEKREEMGETARNVIAGVEMVERELLTVFERHGITALHPEKGTKFDPHLHQAMAEVPDPDVPPGTVVDVFQTGYVIADRLLRPAMVTVARAVTAEEGPQTTDGEDARTGTGS